MTKLPALTVPNNCRFTQKYWNCPAVQCRREPIFRGGILLFALFKTVLPILMIFSKKLLFNPPDTVYNFGIKNKRVKNLPNRYFDITANRHPKHVCNNNNLSVSTYCYEERISRVTGTQLVSDWNSGPNPYILMDPRIPKSEARIRILAEHFLSQWKVERNRYRYVRTLPTSL